MSVEIRLREHMSAQVSLSNQQVAFLREHLSDQIAVLPTGEQERYELHAGSHVGFVMLPEGQIIIIEPKVRVETLFALLAEVYDPSHQIFRDEQQSYTSVQALFEFVVRFFIGQVEDLIARGVLRGYHRVSDNLLTIRGKLLIDETLRRRPGLHDQHRCSFGEFTADIPENQILCSTALLLQPYRYSERNLAARLRRISLALNRVSPSAEARGLFHRITYHRLNEPYRPTLALARLLLEQITFSGSAGREAFLCYMVDMDWLFEAYVSNVVRKMTRHWGVRLCVQESHPLDFGGKIMIRPDMILYDQGRPSLVLDAKYKLLAHQEDLYQMVAYCHALNLQWAVLIHPASEEAPSGVVTVRGQVPLSVFYQSLDLSGNPSQLRTHAEALEQSLADRVLASAQAGSYI